SWRFVDSNIYPDFASNAQAAENLIRPRIGAIDGVISIDYYVVAKILELTGPLDVRGYGTITSGNFISGLLPGDIAGDASHKAILGALAGSLMQRVTSLTPDRWPTLLATFNSLAVQRHLQTFFNKGTVQSEIERIGWSGDLNADKSDFIME